MRVTGIDAFAERLARPGRRRSCGTTTCPGTGASTAEDPVGNRLEFLEPTATRRETGTAR